MQQCRICRSARYRRVARVFIWWSLPACLAVVGSGVADGTEVIGQTASRADVPFRQEYQEAFPIAPGEPADDVRAIAVDFRDRIWAATKAGVYQMESGRRAWKRIPGVTSGPVYAVFPDGDRVLWVGAWDGLYRVEESGVRKMEGVTGPVNVIGRGPPGIYVLGPDGAWQQDGARWIPCHQSWSRNVRDLAYQPERGMWIATGVGLYREFEGAKRLYFREEDLVSSEVNAVAYAPGGRLWVGCVGGIDVYGGRRRINSFVAADGLPNYEVHCLAFEPAGRLWVGTALGVARFDGTSWSLRHSRRWLMDDDVRDVAFDSEGTAWIATRRGVSAIRSQWMTLAEKAEYYLDICRRRHVRPPGLVEKCRFPNPNDLSTWRPMDDDNDGQYTSMYLAMESLRYAVTRDPRAKANADEAFGALEFLQEVTDTPGFVARTVVPATWTQMADANEKVAPPEAVERRVRDPRYKVVEERWHRSADGRWLWKGDTSSDEITGHMFGYLFYYDLAADAGHRRRVRHLVGRIMDYIIDGGYVLRDLDGQATRWGVWSPEKLNGDPDWRVERPINSFEILSFLQTAYHITGEKRYLDEYHRLIDDHGYAENARRPKAYGPAERTHIDDELLALAAPGLLKHVSDEEEHRQFMEGYAWAYHTVAEEQNPFFNFMYGLVGGRDFRLAESVAFLRDTPLDLRQWTVDNSGRDDVNLVRRPMFEPLQLDRMLPPSERGVMRWDKNPWAAISGDFHDLQGTLESCGVFWLLPYWMGRYCGFIGAPQ